MRTLSDYLAVIGGVTVFVCCILGSSVTNDTPLYAMAIIMLVLAFGVCLCIISYLLDKETH